MSAPGAGTRTKRATTLPTEDHMAKKKGAKKKAGKARAKKLSVKKRTVKDLDASKAKSAKGGATALSSDTRAVKFGSAIKFGSLPTVGGDTFTKIG
jgi:hypothetical protein